MVKRLVSEALKKALPQLQTAVASSSNSDTVANEPSTEKKVSKSPQPEKDWQGVPSQELKESKARGAAEEKIRRSFEAIASYNDYTASSFDDKWVVNNQALRQLSGWNGQLVSDWLKRHQIAVDDHNGKHQLTQYHNKRHGGKAISDIINW